MHQYVISYLCDSSNSHSETSSKPEAALRSDLFICLGNLWLDKFFILLIGTSLSHRKLNNTFPVFSSIRGFPTYSSSSCKSSGMFRTFLMAGSSESLS
mmetsp:Transcript_12531/g.18787  ORF Transcript_12531/g.18787 Transcript_12531/m.18787 type:complete len:98 (-) Transcript_12531:1857-2150(-)